MRVLFIIDSLDYGGAETQLIALSRELARRGHAVAIYTLRRENPRLSELAGSGVTVIEDDKRGKFDVLLVRRIRECVRRFRPDVVHGFLLDGNLHARLAVAGTGIPALNSERSDRYRVPLQHRLGILLTRSLVAGLVANTHAGARFAQKHFRLPDSRVHVVWNGIDIRHAAQRRLLPASPALEFFGRSDLKIACVVGRIRPAKDHLLALETARELHRLNRCWRVLFIGDAFARTAGYAEDVMRAAAPLVEQGIVAFAGLRADVHAQVGASQILLSTSRYEGFPNVILEAMAVGTPVVSTEVSDVRLILPCRWQVVPSRSPSELAAAVVTAESDRHTIVERQYEWLNRHATIEIAADRLEQVLHDYAGRASRRPAA